MIGKPKLSLPTVDFVVIRRGEENVKAILHKYGLTREDLKCSICSMDLRDLKRLRAVFPYHDLLICCDKIECVSKCRDKLIEGET
ncbi:MAG: hypothetical protein AOA66_0779 [Candidatus Bathyarchaeota archaeon BA2]|nr:MAG: hypothetical protein AOA66_0779 [Candidatus Bathyarchaeota archaeon BA2]